MLDFGSLQTTLLQHLLKYVQFFWVRPRLRLGLNKIHKDLVAALPTPIGNSSAHDRCLLEFIDGFEIDPFGLGLLIGWIVLESHQSLLELFLAEAYSRQRGGFPVVVIILI